MSVHCVLDSVISDEKSDPSAHSLFPDPRWSEASTADQDVVSPQQTFLAGVAGAPTAPRPYSVPDLEEVCRQAGGAPGS